MPEEIEAQGHMVCSIHDFILSWTGLETSPRKGKKIWDNCGYSLDTFRQTVPQPLTFVGSQLVGKYFRRSIQILKAYEKGLIFCSPDFVSTVYSSHQRVKKSTRTEMETDGVW